MVTRHVRNRTTSASLLLSARFSSRTEERRLTVPKSWCKKLLTGFNFMAHISFSTFVLTRLLQYQYFNVNKLDGQSQIFLELVCLFHLVLPFCCHLCFFLREESFATFINQYLTYYKSIRRWTPMSGGETMCEPPHFFYTHGESLATHVHLPCSHQARITHVSLITQLSCAIISEPNDKNGLT